MLGAQILGAKSNGSSDSWVFIRSVVVASRASQVWNPGIFLACIPGARIEGGARELLEDRAGGQGASDSGFWQKGRGPRRRSARGPEQGGAVGSFFRPALGS